MTYELLITCSWEEYDKHSIKFTFFCLVLTDQLFMGEVNLKILEKLITFKNFDDNFQENGL